ncbi:MAG: type I methionyl aminopeptidase [Chitinivibrionales bacterium]|nr:type I methionyl aminopeptidase [Chitinivibrionales bacterium]
MIGRNDPCWCGSGKKYKRCHLLTDLKGRDRGADSSRAGPAKTEEQIEGMREAGRANGVLMDEVRTMVRPGVTTDAIDRFVHEYTRDHGYTPATLGYHGFPKSCCVSKNDVVCHGIPSDDQVLREGDIVNVDLTTIVDGYYGDSSETFMIGEVSADARHLVEVAARALLLGIEAVKPGQPIDRIAHAIDPYVRTQRCSVVRQYTGHGIGREFHERFSVYHHEAADNENIVMRPGMTFTIEPMINLGDYRVVTDAQDGWTVRTRDGSLSAQYEHTVLVTATGVEVLTLTPSQRAAGTYLIVEGLAL